MWEVHYSREAATYLEDNGQLIADLFFAMESLADTEGRPINNYVEDVQGLIYWLIEGHTAVYRRAESEQVARIISIKPD